MKYLILILIMAFFLLSFRINKPFYGHHDWNGVFFGNIIRNTQKFGFLKTKFGAVYTFLPKNTQEFSFYTHYPPIFHLLLSLEAKLFGVHEWSMRLFSIAMTLIGLFYFYKISTLLLNERIALVASLFFIINPMFLYFGKMPIHEVFGLTFVAFSILHYLIFFQKQNKKNLIFLIISLILACETVWSGYYLAPLFIVHYLLFKNKAKKKSFALIILTPLLLFLIHLIHTYILTGSFTNNLFSTMLFRMQLGKKAADYQFTPFQYLKQESLWLTVYFTRILCLLSFIYSIRLLIKILRKKINYKEGLLLILLIFPFIDVIIFRNVCYIHDYKLYYFLLSIPLFASAGTCYLLNIFDKWWSRKGIISWIVVVLVIMLAGLERFKFTKTLLLSSMNKPAYDLGLILQQKTKGDEGILVGSPSFGEFMNFFVNLYGQRKIIYFEPNLAEFKKVFSEDVSLIVFVKGKEKPSLDLISFLKEQYSLQEDNQFIFFTTKK